MEGVSAKWERAMNVRIIGEIVATRRLYYFDERTKDKQLVYSWENLNPRQIPPNFNARFS